MNLLRLRLRQSVEEDPPDWERPCEAERKLALLYSTGEIEDDDAGPGVLETHWAPRPPRWVTTPPTEPGLYLIRAPGADRATWRVLDVDYSPSGRLVGLWTDI